MRARERGGAERGGIGAMLWRNDRYERPRIIIIIAGRRSRENTQIFVIYFFYLLFPNWSKQSSPNEVLISIYTFDSLSNNIGRYVFFFF